MAPDDTFDHVIASKKYKLSLGMIALPVALIAAPLSFQLTTFSMFPNHLL
jgi:hypothetical protein